MDIIPISYHGGHSGEFCAHAEDKLEAIVQAYIARGFTNFGITEHQPRTREFFYHPEEDNFGDNHLFLGFYEYMRVARLLQDDYQDEANILIGFETEMCEENPLASIVSLREDYRPDYIVGSVHHVKGIPFDFNEQSYEQATEKCGSLEALYKTYYQSQYALILACCPEIIGHFDLIKIFSEDFKYTPEILGLAQRNIDKAISYGGVFEVNARAFKKGLEEPYPGRVFLKIIAEMGGEVTLGDDSHGVNQIGLHYDKSIPIVREFFDHVVAFRKARTGIEKFAIPL